MKSLLTLVLITLTSVCKSQFIFKDTLAFRIENQVKIPILVAYYYSKFSNDTFRLSKNPVEEFPDRFEFLQGGVFIINGGKHICGGAEAIITGRYLLEDKKIILIIEDPEDFQKTKGGGYTIQGDFPENFALIKSK